MPEISIFNDPCNGENDNRVNYRKRANAFYSFVTQPRRWARVTSKYTNYIIKRNELNIRFD